MSQHIEVSRAESPLTLKEGNFPAGTYVVRLDQPYRNYAVDLLAPQVYPKDATEPYDDVSWQLPAHYHLKALPTADASVRNAALTALTEPPKPSGEVAGSGPVFLLKDSGQESLLAARYQLSAFNVEIAEKEFSSGGVAYPEGSWILPAQAGLADALHQASSKLGLSFVSAAAAPEVAHHAAKAPRLGVWVPWADTDSIGWVRYSLDQRNVPYVYVRDEDIRAGKLNEKIDVLLYGNVDLELPEQIQGLPKRWSPMAFKKSAQSPALGTPAETDDITGGIGYEGLAQIQEFIERGGLFITLGSGSMLAVGSGARSWSAARCGRRATQFTGRRQRSSGRGATIVYAHSGFAPARHVRPPGASDRVRLFRAHLRLSPEFSALCNAAALAANGLLHHMPGWAGGCEQRGSGVGRHGGRADPGERADLGSCEPDWAAGDSGFAGGQRPRGDVQF